MTKATIQIVDKNERDVTDAVEKITVTNHTTGNIINKRTDGYYYLNPENLYIIDVVVNAAYMVSVDHIPWTDSPELIRVEVDHV